MRVDFYQLGAAQPENVIAAIAAKLLDEQQRLLIVADDEAYLARLDRQLWDQGAASFLPHALSGGADDAAQPILLSTGTDAPNLARNMLIADGEWREAGSITAAQFIKRFVDDGVAWAHLDIAGMAWSDKAKPTYDKGATGYGVRLLDQYIADTVEG